MKLHPKTFLSLLIICALSTSAKKIETISNDDWDSAALWSSGELPAAGDTIVIRNYVTFNRSILVQAPSIIIVETGATLCGEFFLEVECGAKLYNYGNIYCGWLVVSKAENHNNISLMKMYSVNSCSLETGAYAFQNIGGGIVNIGSHPACQRTNTGINPNSLSNYISVSPNPILYGHVKISAPGDLLVDLFDRTGRLLQHTTGTDQVLLSVDDYPKGIYFALIRTEKEVIRKKILKN